MRLTTGRVRAAAQVLDSYAMSWPGVTSALETLSDALSSLGDHAGALESDLAATRAALSAEKAAAHDAARRRGCDSCRRG